MFAESVFRHVILQRDISLDDTTTFFESLTGTDHQDPRTLIQQFLGLKKMKDFDEVLKPILRHPA